MTVSTRDVVAVFAAQIMIRQYGDEARERAEACMAQMHARGDLANVARWAAILRSIDELEAEEQGRRLH